MQNKTSLEIGREQAIRFNHPEWTDEQVNDRMQELADYCEQRQKEWHNPKLAAIWSKRNENKSRKNY